MAIDIEWSRSERTAATLDDLIWAIRTKQLALVELLFDIDRPLADHDGTELAALVDQPLGPPLYQDDELALLLPECDIDSIEAGRPISWWLGLREAYLVGRDDTPTEFFVHTVDGTHLTGASEVTQEMIRDALGFDRELALDTTVLALDASERVRIQGDLCLEWTQTADGLRDWVEDRSRRAIERAVTEEFADQYLRRCGLDEYREQLRIHGHGMDLSVTLRRSRHAAGAISAIEDRYSEQSRPERTQAAYLDPFQRQRATRQVERRLSNYLKGHRDEYLETVKRRLARRVDDELGDYGQLYLPIDNHLVILENARLHPEDPGEQEPVRIVVPDRTSLHVLHDEHPQVGVLLEPGLYTCYLFPRSIQPAAERPDW